MDCKTHTPVQRHSYTGVRNQKGTPLSGMTPHNNDTFDSWHSKQFNELGTDANIRLAHVRARLLINADSPLSKLNSSMSLG
jgi:hypothetical protein